MAKRGRPRHPDILTPREWEVLALVREGLSNEQIAERLGTTERTARYHVSEILSKLGVSTRQEAAAWQPEERRPWWTLAMGPLALWRRGWAGAAATAAALLVVGAGLGFLVWGLARTQGEASTKATALAVGEEHACVVVGGDVKCWGDNIWGALGDGTTTERYTPVSVVGLDGRVTSISAGAAYTCALSAAGNVKCWGDDLYGQLGDGRSGSLENGANASSDRPVDIVGLRGVIAIGAGANHTCALTSAHAVNCWGDNSYGQLGDGTTTLRSTPIDVVGLSSGVQAIAVGGNFTCALTVEGTVECWGSNSEGQLAAITDASCGPPGFVFGCNMTPRPVAKLSSGVSAIAASGEGQHACAITVEGRLECWGTNAVGQLGVETTQTCSSPTQRCATAPLDVPGAGRVIAVALGPYHTCAALASGGVKCWGDNFAGKLGDGTTVSRSTPVDVVGLGRRVLAIGAGRRSTCALVAARDVRCWGADEMGQLGDRTPGDATCSCRTTPVDVLGLVEESGGGHAGTVTPEPIDGYVWQGFGEPSRLTVSTAPMCGDDATATEYGVPRMLVSSGYDSFFRAGAARLGLEAKPYPYAAKQIVPVEWVGPAPSPSRWEVSGRRIDYPSPQISFGPFTYVRSEVFLRRLDKPDLLFRYGAELCPQENGLPGRRLLAEEYVLQLPKQLPKIVEHRQGDFISAEEAITIAVQRDVPGVRGVWAALGTPQDFAGENHPPIAEDGNQPDQAVWLVFLALGDLGGPHRPGHDIARYYEINATTGQVIQGGGCCYGVIYSP